MKKKKKKINTMTNNLSSPFPHVIRRGVEVSVIYNYYKKEETLFTSLKSLKKQSMTMCMPCEVEIILIDDGAERENIREKLPPEVIYLWQRKCGYGISRAKNTGAKISNGKYLLFLDPDITICPTFIDAMLRGFHHYGDRVLQCGYIWGYHFEGSPDPRTEFGVWENPNSMTSRFYQVAGGVLAISKVLFEEVGGFDEDLIYGGVEDLHFGHTVSCMPRTGIVFNTEMETWHIPHPPGSAHVDEKKSWEIVKQKSPDFYNDYIVRGLR